MTLASRIPVVSGKSYLVVLHFAEMIFKNAGARVMKIGINDVIQNEALDVYSQVGEKTAFVKSYAVDSPSNFLKV